MPSLCCEIFGFFRCLLLLCLCEIPSLRVLTGGTNVQSGYIQVKPQERVSCGITLILTLIIRRRTLGHIAVEKSHNCTSLLNRQVRIPQNFFFACIWNILNTTNSREKLPQHALSKFWKKYSERKYPFIHHASLPDQQMESSEAQRHCCNNSKILKSRST